jgi:hypothetical protein
MSGRHAVGRMSWTNNEVNASMNAFPCIKLVSFAVRRFSFGRQNLFLNLQFRWISFDLFRQYNQILKWSGLKTDLSWQVQTAQTPDHEDQTQGLLFSCLVFLWTSTFENCHSTDPFACGCLAVSTCCNLCYTLVFDKVCKYLTLRQKRLGTGTLKADSNRG